MRKLLITFFLVCGVLFLACDKSEDTTNAADNSDIPANPTGVTVPTPTQNNVQPTSAPPQIEPDNPSRIKLNMTGIIDPNTLQPIAFNYDPNNPQNSNIFITQDGVVQGLKTTLVSTGTQLNADVVFTVDNSGSMNQESDSVAASIIEFANFLVAQGLNVQFGVVGQYGNVNGALDLTNAQNLDSYLNRPYVSGTSRTVGFAGSDSARLETAAYAFHNAGDENGVVAVLFADTNFTWRSGAQRVFVNFTDEPTQNYSTPYWNAAYMCAALGGSATVHTVFSADTNRTWTPTDERPWRMSECAGGTVVFFDSYATGMDLRNLPVAGALANSYLVEYVNSAGVGVHQVIITIYTSTADGSRTYSWTY